MHRLPCSTLTVLGPRSNADCQLEHGGAPRSLAQLGFWLSAGAAEKQKPAHVLFEQFSELLAYAPEIG